MPLFPRHGDLDNLSKFVLNTMNGVLFDDDSQVVFLHAKNYGSRTIGASVVLQYESLSSIYESCEISNIKKQQQKLTMAKFQVTRTFILNSFESYNCRI